MIDLAAMFSNPKMDFLGFPVKNSFETLTPLRLDFIVSEPAILPCWLYKFTAEPLLKPFVPDGEGLADVLNLDIHISLIGWMYENIAPAQQSR
jgi:hypothetical protein